MAIVTTITPRFSGKNSTCESASHWAVFYRHEVEQVHGSLADIADRSDRDYYDLIAELTSWFESYGGAGRWFWSKPSMRISKKYVMIRQHGGLDV